MFRYKSNVSIDWDAIFFANNHVFHQLSDRPLTSTLRNLAFKKYIMPVSLNYKICSQALLHGSKKRTLSLM